MSPLPEILFAIPRNPILAVGLPVGLGMASGFFSSPRSGKRTEKWYESMVSPPGVPPRAAFPTVWTALYGMMGYASHLAVKSFDAAATPDGTAKADNALQLYYAQLALNLLWSPIFFGSQSPKIALVNIVALTATAAKWALDMSDIYTTPISANWLTVPYLAWLGYATYLNAGYALLNWERPGDKRI
ncbi:hypothetical protein QFC24_003500 [Naganishia onofrii]|uniref:Uncharacterized protein n=2 Tax=Naganishia TaxID=1851509 RepID=A0ACC2W799_9TREE|nr:hypothetical protein QFC21_000803 [Naganishia friedmannii]KAJ9123726.1 hypothetical protein QFC24_003500 [Naganishia onofrii]